MSGNITSTDSIPAPPFNWRNFLFSFRGRSTRFDYWVRFTLAYFVINVALAIIDSMLLPQIAGGVGILSVVFAILGIWPSLAVSVKRCHDRGRSGWFLLISFIPLIGAIWLLIDLGFRRGTVGENRFGADPLAVA